MRQGELHPTLLTHEDFIRVTSLCERLTATLTQEAQAKENFQTALRDVAPEHPLLEFVHEKRASIFSEQKEPASPM